MSSWHNEIFVSVILRNSNVLANASRTIENIVNEETDLVTRKTRGNRTYDVQNYNFEDITH